MKQSLIFLTAHRFEARIAIRIVMAALFSYIGRSGSVWVGKRYRAMNSGEKFWFFWIVGSMALTSNSYESLDWTLWYGVFAIDVVMVCWAWRYVRSKPNSDSRLEGGMPKGGPQT